MDRSSEWAEAIERACHEQHISLDKLRSSSANKNTTSFTQLALSVVESTANLRDFIRLHQKDYLGSIVYSEKDKDSIEAEIGLTVKAVGQQIETLKNSVLAAQGSPLAPPAAVAALKEQKQARGDASDKPNINEQTAAHLHGVVLCLAESLHAVTSRFDKARAQRYQQLNDKATRRAATHTGSSKGSAPTGTGNSKASTSLHPSSAPSWFPSGISQGLSHVGADKATAQARRMGTALLGRVKGASDVLRGAGEAAWTAASGSTAAPGNNGVAVRGPFGLGTTAGNSSTSSLPGTIVSVSHVNNEEGLTADMWPGTVKPETAPLSQQQTLMQTENHDLVAQLTQLAHGVHGVERTVREIAVLNQMFSTAILHQAEAIETIYNQAVEASQHIKLGNKELKKTVAVNRSTQKYILILLLAATLGLLFFDWFNS